MPVKTMARPSVGGGDDVLVLYGSAGLNDGGCAGGGDGFETVGEWEEGVEAATVPWSGRTAFCAPNFAASTRLIWPAPMPTVWPSRA